MSQPGSASARQVEYQKREPEKTAARQALKAAIKAGRVVRPDACEACGAASKPHGHHHDYRQPFAVAWLCAPCHGKVHAAIRARQAAEWKAAAAGPQTGSVDYDGRRIGSERQAILDRLRGDGAATSLRHRLMCAIAFPVTPWNPKPVRERLLDIRRSVTLPPERRRVIEELVATYR